MPHQCTSCGRTFPDGSKEMLSGCPDCGGNKFQFRPKGFSEDDGPSPSEPEAQPPESETQSSSQGSSPQPTSRQSPDEVNDTATAPDSDTGPTAAEDAPRSASEPADSKRTDPRSSKTEHVSERTDEDAAQASARSDVVSPDELDQASRDVDEDPTREPADAEASDADRPDIGDLREELNEQFESIRIVSPGKYELNLMELYDRQEYIISLQEDGRYVIEMPDAWGISEE